MPRGQSNPPQLPVDLEFARIVWPYDVDLQSPCIRHPNAYYGRKTVLRYLAELILDRPLDPLWRFERRCKTRHCRNILHYEMKKSWDPQGSRIAEPLPTEVNSPFG